MNDHIFTATLDWLAFTVPQATGRDRLRRRGLVRDDDGLSWLSRLLAHDECKPGGRQTGKRAASSRNRTRAGRTFCGDGPITNPYSANKPRI